MFRSHRTFQNSLENLAVLVFPAFLAMFVSVSPTILAYTVWVFALARIGHMVLYYCLATELNPSPRSYFYMIALLATLWLYGMLAWQLLSSGA
ncbi:MAPEG family protein [Alteromonas sp. ASW11-19]|uniref:MAPEG family protein n=1 Tax=Alteromonas salexigens TaxID=2982530 RepID=A0ABT2VN79_9ALTE|nr:MAPEG family protein [Alteromonas salexigens]MCU7553691.1 MAPEG family protein [Alteromonas salexigens]